MELTKDMLQNAIDLNTKMKGVYFWKSPSYASSRRYIERLNSLSLDGYYNGHHIEIDMVTVCRCRYVKFNQRILVDGMKTNITKIKNMVKK